MNVTVVGQAVEAAHVPARAGGATTAIIATKLTAPANELPRRLFDTAGFPSSHPARSGPSWVIDILLRHRPAGAIRVLVCQLLVILRGFR
ncbi:MULTISPECIES: hypothetical protein [Streptosporangium]|uniref:Uncharacterized protein n=1 Tax=Streptosporangium brasiliense TaxID=47480 RepID=A0ABT9RFH3_9ACTN|nr:hypothetical protein [Streptosporangium brasiliense]MDP9868047.1 hypothetical protein [Streptosporangium brasiliense]